MPCVLSGFFSSASYISSICDTGIDNPKYGWFIVRKTTLTETQIDFFMRSSVNSDMSSPSSWIETIPKEQTEIDDEYLAWRTGDWVVIITHTLPSRRYVQWKSTMATTNVKKSPSIWYAKVTWINPTASFVSQDKVVPGSLYKYRRFLSQSVTNGNVIQYSIASANTSNGLATATYTVVSSGDDLTSVIGSNKFMKWKSSYTINYATSPPYTQAVMLNWYENSTPITPAMEVFDNRLWIAMSTDTADSYNDAVFILDKNLKWATPVIGLNPSHFWNFKNDLYYSDNSDNTFYVYNSTTHFDSGNNVYYQWKKEKNDFTMPNNDKRLIYVYLTGGEKSGTVDFEYRIENTTNSYTVDIDQSSNYDKRIPIKSLSGVRSYDYIIKSTSPFEIHRINSYFIPEKLR